MLSVATVQNCGRNRALKGMYKCYGKSASDKDQANEQKRLLAAYFAFLNGDDLIKKDRLLLAVDRSCTQGRDGEFICLSIPGFDAHMVTRLK